jgi:hypothetical protein
VRRRPVIIRVLVWLVITGVYASYYVLDRVTSPDATPGYETDWSFQLLAFSIVRLETDDYVVVNLQFRAASPESRAPS